MEHWYDYLNSFPETPDVKIYLQTIQTIVNITKEDLAEFEVEYLTSTVFYKPVSIFSCISSHRNNSIWAQVIEKCFKLIADIVQKFGDYVQKYIQDIVDLCQQPYAPTTRRHALNCLATVVRHTQSPLTTIARLIAELQTSETCRAPLALLVGAICEHHPQDVSESIEMIWRTYLKLLEGRANSETIPASILQGVSGVFKNFGVDLPTNEVNELYDTMVQLLFTNGKCENVCLIILTNYAELFPERLRGDQKTRAFLWKKLPQSASAIQSVYRSFKSFNDFQSIIQREITPRLKSNYYLERFTALRVINDVNITKMYTDIHHVIYEIRSNNTSPEILESIQLIVESNLPDSDKLLRVCVDKYDVIPKNKKAQVFVHTLLEASEEVRYNVLQYLIFESCQPNMSDDSQSKYYLIWSDIFNVDGGKDTVVLERSRLVYEEFMLDFLEVLNINAFDDDNIPQHIHLLIDLSAHIITSYDKENAWYAHALRTRCSYDAVKTLANACVNRSLVDLNQILDIKRCADEASMCECCLAVITAPSEASLSDGTILEALQILFSTNKISEESLLLSLNKMESLMLKNQQDFNRNIVNDIIHKISKIEHRRDLTSKEGRILRQDVALFLAKFHNATQLYNPLNCNDNFLLSTAEDLTLSVLNSMDGSVHKIDIKSLLHTALIEEEPRVLKSILALICSGTSENHIRLTASISIAQCSCHVRGESVQAPLSRVHRDAIHHVIQCLSSQSSPGLRRMLSDGIRDMVSCAGVDTEHTLQVIAEHVKIMLINEKVETVRAGLDLSRTLLSLLNDKPNHTTMQEILPQLILLTADTCQNESPAILQEASNTLIEKLALFDISTINDTIKRALSKLLNKDLTVDRNVKIFKKMASQFVRVIKSIYDGCEMEGRNIFEFVEGGKFENRMYVLAIVRQVFQISSEDCKGLMTETLLEELYTYELRDKNYFAFMSILKFFSQYCGLLLELRYQNSLLRLREIIQFMTPDIILKIKITFKQCLTDLKNELNKLPQNLLATIEQFVNNLNLEHITLQLNDGDISADMELSVSAVKVVIESLDEESLASFVIMKNIITEWPEIIIRLFASGRLHEDLKFKMSLMTDVMKLSLSFMTVEEIKRLILEAGVSGMPNERIGIDFCRHFVSSFYRYLLQKPLILLTDDMKGCSSLMNDVIKQHMKLNFPDEDTISVLELVDDLWPTYANNSTFKQKYDLLLSLNEFPKRLNPESNPVRWMEVTICGGGEFNDLLLSVLPEGKSYSDCYAQITKDMPLRLSEMDTRWRTTFAAMLDCLSNTGDLALLDIVAKFAAGDATAGWWDDQFAACALSLSKRQDDSLIDRLYALCLDIPSLCLVERLLLPVLRYSPTATSDAFFSRHLPELLSSISKTVPTNAGDRYKANIIVNTRAVIIVTVAFEKPSNTIDWQTGREVCKKCVTLRDKLHKTTDETAKEEHRRLHAACYKAVAFALVRWRRFDVSVGKFVCSETAFKGLVGEIDAPIGSYQSTRTIRQSCVSDDVTSLQTSILTHTHARTPVLMTYFTDNPAIYDLTEEVQKQTEEVQEITLPDNPLNKHESAAAMIAVICHLSKLSSTDWLDAIVGALTSDMRCQDKWLVCQIICNLKELLSPHANKLRPALIEIVASADGQILNAVHLNILETLSDWGYQDETILPNLPTVLSNLINTCLVYSEKNYIFYTLDSVMVKFMKCFEKQLSVTEEVSGKLVANTNKNNTKIITHLLQHKIIIPNLMTSILESITANRLTNIDSKHFGLLNPNEEQLNMFRSMLESIKRSNAQDYVKYLFNVQMQCDKVCDKRQFRMIVDLVPKIKLGDSKKKCLNIISKYISTNTNNYVQDMFDTIEICELLLTDYVIDALLIVRNGHSQMSNAVRNRAINVIRDLCGNVSVKVRAAAFDAVNVMLRDALSQEHHAHQSKRPKLSQSKVLHLSNNAEVSSIVNYVCVGTTDKDGGIASMCRTTLTQLLSDNLNIRFAECLHLVLHLPSKVYIQKQMDICACVGAILEMLFHGLRQTDLWVRQKIELPKIQRQESDSLLLTMSRTYQGTFTKTLGTNQIKTKKQDVKDEETSLSIEEILSSFIEFAKNNTQAALNLISSVASSLKPTSPELDALWEPVLMEGLTQVNDITCLLLYVCRAGYVTNSLQPQVSKLRNLTTSTEGYCITNLLHEELNLKYQNHSQFILGDINPSMEVDDDKLDKYDEEFSITKLTSAFKKLSNWDNLTMQEQNKLRSADLPVLWIDKDSFSNVLQNYTDSKDWFETLSHACLDQKQSAMNLLNEINKWPKRPFIVSALSEAIDWQSCRQFEVEKSQYKEFVIPKDDCLVEWAARLMLRYIYLQRQGSDEIALSRSHELRWCERASEMAIPGVVNQCIERNSDEDWNSSEVLPWLHQKILSELCIGNNRLEVARKCLDKLESTVPTYFEDTSTDVLLDMNALKIKLLHLCGELSQKNLQDVMENSNCLYEDSSPTYTVKSKNCMKSFYEQAIVFYGNNYNNVHKQIINNIVQISITVNKMKQYDILDRIHVDYLVTSLEQLTDIRLTDGPSGDSIKTILDELQILLPHLDDCSLQQIRHNLPPKFLNLHPQMKEKLQQKKAMSRSSLCLQLVCEAKFSLRQFCEQLMKIVDDGEHNKWREVFVRMKRRIFENKDAGIDYQLLLNKQLKQQLYALQDAFETDKPKIRSTLQSIVTYIGKPLTQTTLRLSQLCPYLRSDSITDDLELRDLIGCKKIFRIDEQVQVYTDSIRQPCVLKVLQTDGTTQYYIHKSGEELRRDAAAQRVAEIIKKEGFNVGTYGVRVLDDDSALIERLENHQRLGSFIPGTNDVLANMPFDPRPANNLLILSPSTSLVNHHIRLSEKVPVHSLRSAIEKNSSCVEDFLMKKNNFQESLAAMTIITFILGLGDRHLNNILYGSTDGTILSVDWGAVLWTADYELTAARLTRCLLAVVNTKVLESRLQKMLSYLRETLKKNLFYATIRTSFCWSEPQLIDKLKYAKGILYGNYLSYHITNEVIMESKMASKQKYVELVQKVFENYPQKDFYTVEEQITCLLKQCTSYEILGAIRKEWEPWV